MKTKDRGEWSDSIPMIKLPPEHIEIAEQSRVDWFGYKYLAKLPESEQEIYLQEKQDEIFRLKDKQIS